MRLNQASLYSNPNYSQQKIYSRVQINQFIPSIRYQQQNSNGNATLRKYHQKTEQLMPQQIYLHSIKTINQQIYHIINMDPHDIQFYLRNSTKNLCRYVNSQLLFSLKTTSSVRLLMHQIMLLYIHQTSKYYSEKQKQKSKQKSLSINIKQKNKLSSSQQRISSNKNINNLITIQKIHNFPHDIPTLKQTIPFIPKPKDKQKSSQRNKLISNLDQEFRLRLQSTKQYLQTIIRKIQLQYNQNTFKLAADDVIKLKKSYINVAEMRNTLSNVIKQQIQNSQNQQSQSRPQSNHSKSDYNQSSSRPQSSNRYRQDQSNKIQNNSPNQQYAKKYDDNRNRSKSKTCFMVNSGKQVEQQTDQSNQLLIEQLQQIIQKKQVRIKQLTRQLAKSLTDQKQLQTTIQTFQLELNEFEQERKNYTEIIQKIQQENLNYQLQITQLQEINKVKNKTHQLNSSQLENSQTYEYLKQFEKRQKILKFTIFKEIDLNIQNQNNQKWNSLSANDGFNDISEITPKRFNPKTSFNEQSDRQFQGNNISTIRKGLNSREKRTGSKQKINDENDRSFNKFQIYSNNKMQSKVQLLPRQLKDTERDSFQKILLLQAITIQQLMQNL